MLGQVVTSENRQKNRHGSKVNYLKTFLIENVSTICLSNIWKQVKKAKLDKTRKLRYLLLRNI